MCGIFGTIKNGLINKTDLKILADHARQRGRDSSGLVKYNKQCYTISRADFDITKLLDGEKERFSNFVMGHSRLITNGLSDNQPVVRDGLCLIHNGIIVNVDEVWEAVGLKPNYQIDSEAILGVALKHINDGENLEELPDKIFSMCNGTISCALLVPEKGKLLLFSNNGSLYKGKQYDTTYFSSERYPLEKLGCKEVTQIFRDGHILDIPVNQNMEMVDNRSRTLNLIPKFKNIKEEENLLEYIEHNLKRCTKCLLPETMPFITFDTEGVCNYCKNYKLRNIPRPKKELFELVEPYRRKNEADCIVPFSGGRDSCYGLHLIVNELKMRPITYTYDWGMVTDLGRRNISRMCSILGVENIIVADDISKKRQNIALNLKAWLKSPHLGMVSIDSRR